MKIIRLTLALLLFTSLAQAQNVKDFSLTSVIDKTTFTLSKSKGKFIALHFLLKTECPYCIRHTSEYFEKASSLSFYQKGAWALFVLHEEIGDKAFKKAVKNYLKNLILKFY